MCVVAIVLKKIIYLFQSSPAVVCPTGRTSDLNAILDVMDRATEYIHVAVMDYFPVTLYSPEVM